MRPCHEAPTEGKNGSGERSAAPARREPNAQAHCRPAPVGIASGGARLADSTRVELAVFVASACFALGTYRRCAGAARRHPAPAAARSIAPRGLLGRTGLDGTPPGPGGANAPSGLRAARGQRRSSAAPIRPRRSSERPRPRGSTRPPRHAPSRRCAARGVASGPGSYGPLRGACAASQRSRHHASLPRTHAR